MQKRFYFKIFLILTLCCGLFFKAQYISVDNVYTPEQLVKNIFLGNANSNCVEVSNVQVSGWDFGSGDLSYGYFNKANSSFQLNEGILLSTGRIFEAPGPNNGITSSSAGNWFGDSDLENALGVGGTINATILEFDFIPKQTNKISFDYIFASEQYLTNPRADQCGYTDGFAFLIKKANSSDSYKNIAVVPNTNIPVSVNTVRGPGTICPVSNAEYFEGFNAQNSPVSFNGQTKILTAKADVIPGEKYHIKLVIADQGNGLYDSGVFLKAGSFLGNKDLGIDRLISTNNALCGGSSLVLDATTLGATYQWYKDNTPLTGETNATYTVTSPGTYSVIITNSGCNLKGEIKIEYITEAPTLKDLTISNCDDDFDGKIPVDFTQIIPQVSDDLQGYQLSFYSDPNYINVLPTNWSYSANTRVYVKTNSSSSGCPPITSVIDFKFGDKVPINSPVSQNICSQNTSQDILLSDYTNFFTTDTSVSFKFYKTFADAQANVSGAEISANQTINQDETYYIRFSKNGVCDNIGTLNLSFKKVTYSTTLPANITICEGSTTILDAGSGFISYLWSTGETTPEITVGKGNYFVDLTSPNGCKVRQNVEVKEEAKAVLNISFYSGENCDDDFDGNINIKLSDITPIILPNNSSFTVKYYSSDAFAQIGGNNNLPDNYSYNSNTTIYVRVESAICPPIIEPLDLKIGNSLPLIKTSTTISECDDNLDGIKSVDLSKYLAEFTTDSNVNVSYYDDLQNAKNQQNAISNPITINKNGTFYLRFSKTNFCPVIAILNINIKVPKASDILKDKVICPGTKTILEAGNGFASYLWSTGETSSTIEVVEGDYFVDLTSSNGCVYRQKVSVLVSLFPIISQINITGKTVEIMATGGTKPYEYSIDGINYQTSNIFTNVSRGVHTAFVKSSDGCGIITKDFIIINLINVITPNGDGKNDVLDYTDLKIKNDVSLEIFDRNGKLVFKNLDKTYNWDGKSNGRNLPTGSYWYILKWTEPDTQIAVVYNNWILLKNR
ncbi:choice-of-anchor L domain-containing protein [Halpernia sp.]|uniref:choice-of-anchor L domain-containing protein n=1 Tax=Halpernia sp. TaxID=2782209 RepID=UPI003A8DC523